MPAPLRRLSIVMLALCATLLALPAHAQFGDAPKPEELVKVAAPKVALKAGGAAGVAVTLTVLDGWHINAHPAAEGMIETAVEIAAAHGVSAAPATYPPPQIEKLAFDDNPLLVWSHEATVRVPLRAAASTVNGAHTLKGVVRFQACNDQVCMAPTRVPFEVVVEVSGGAAAGSVPPADTAASATTTPPPTQDAIPAPSAGFEVAPPAGADARAPRNAALDNPLARRLGSGTWAAYLTIFLIGLALNLTPCVYPMLGVTVSIFGARRAAPPLHVVGFALLYVLGMALMYSALGLLAAFTGGLFGAFLQSPVVLVAIGVLMIGLSLSMFGIYEINLPPALLSRLGGATATSAAGVFLSGLVVGVFAAPCIGPPVVALLAVVGAKGDPWFGFTSFFTLAMGLGFPYLILGTFSNLIQTLPRSGEWMVWVKKLFGVILLAVGLYYLMLVVNADWVEWVLPVALFAGGIYLGFFEKSANARPGFRSLKWITGVAAVIAAVWFSSTNLAKGLEFRDASEATLHAAAASGRPVMVAFSADWCVPCHELENLTFTDARVIRAAREFETFAVDLTRYDSPEADRWRRQFGITGVPTVVFLGADGREVREARVEGFLPADAFLERMRVAAAGAARADLE